MSELLEPTPCLCIGSFIYRSDIYSREQVEKLFKQKFSIASSFSPSFNELFAYYSKEMGPENSLERLVFCSQEEVQRNEIVDLKIWADKIERDTMRSGSRTINFDIGFISLENFILATGKPFSHRVYLDRGVWADLTLSYQAQKFGTLPWTYPDWGRGEFVSYLGICRQTLKKSIDWQANLKK